MESSVDSYLHKKFKKQLSIEPRHNANNNNNNNNKENNKDDVKILERNHEKKPVPLENGDQIIKTTTSDNTILYTVPNSSSTNLILKNESLINVARNDIVHNVINNSTSSSKSSISNPIVNLQQSQHNISYVPNIHRYDVNFDNTNVGQKSSIFEANFYKSYNFKAEETAAVNDNSGVVVVSNDGEQIRNEETQPSVLVTVADKTSGGTGKYVCTYCNLACSKPSVLQKHIRAHTNERPYPCVSCGFSFKTRSNLYKHCRSRTHANRVLGSKARGELNNDEHESYDTKLVEIQTETNANGENQKSKLYKPRFHTSYEQTSKENIDDENKTNGNSDILSHHINELINKKNSNETYPKKDNSYAETLKLSDEPLNLTNKGSTSCSRKRCISEAVVESKSLIKELLLQNLSSDMQCIHCKMIFQTVTELELHKLRSCKGFVQPGIKYARSSSVNVASILTQNKNAFDNIPQMQTTVFPLKSPGPFLGKTRLVESDKYSKSFSFDDTLPNVSKYLLSPLNEKKTPQIKLFGGEVKISESTNENSTMKIDDNKGDTYENSAPNFLNYGGKISENRVIKSGLHSGGTVVTNNKDSVGVGTTQNVIIYDSITSTSNKMERKKPPDLVLNSLNNEDHHQPSPSLKYTNIIDFSQNAVKLLTPNLKQPNLMVPGLPVPNKFTYNTTNTPENYVNPLKIEINEESPQNLSRSTKIESQKNLYHPMNIFVNGKIVRYVPGMPGPVIAETPPTPSIEPGFKELSFGTDEQKLEIRVNSPTKVSEKEMRSPVIKLSSPKKFSRPNSLALKPTPVSLKQHHGLTPTMFNQILISPETPRIAKKYVQQYLNGNYFSYLGLKSSTKPTYCTINKTQPFYVPHFKKLSMYSEWRQQDTKTDKLYVAGYDSRQRSSKYSIAGKKCDLLVHPSYKNTIADPTKDKEDNQKSIGILGGYECNDEYTYIRGRGRGRYVCEQCGIRCKKPSMLKKHIRTHSNDRPYTCSHCNFSFKTKGNLTKHMKSKAHTKNSTTSSCSSSTSTLQSGTPTSESDTDDSGMDSSDESTRQQEHEAAYGLLSLSQKSTHNNTNGSSLPSISSNDLHNHTKLETNRIMNNEEIAYVTKTNYAKNKFLDQPPVLKFKNIKELSNGDEEDGHNENTNTYLALSGNRPLTYPYVMSEVAYEEPMSVSSENTDISSGRFDTRTPELSEFKCIKKFHVIQKYTSEKDYNNMEINENLENRCLDRNNELSVIVTQKPTQLNVYNENFKRKLTDDEEISSKIQKNDEVIDLSVNKNTENVEHNNMTNSKNLILSSPQDVLKMREMDLVRNNGSNVIYNNQNSNNTADFDNSAMETLADIATKQVKLEKNAMAKSVASEYLKLATKQEFVGENERFQPKDVNDLLVKAEGNKSCTICSKSFNKPSQLRLHMNVHYLERPFRCESCSVSFRTKGHLQKHERSASHHNKLSTSPALSSSEPRPFKCADCNIAFRIHGHLAKHLRSKMHIMKLECLAKIPFGLYAELERSNSLLTEINTTDGDQCLESLRILAKKVLSNDANKLEQRMVELVDAD